MKTNEGSIDRVLRLLAGIVLLVVAFAAFGIGTVPGVVAALIGAVLLITAAVGFCPAYALFGFKTCPTSR